MCSKCFKETLGTSTKTEEPIAKKVESSGKVTMPAVEDDMVKSEEEPTTKPEKEEEPEKPKQEDKNKCFSCAKKVGIYGFTCKCDFTFCKRHRLPEQHDCEFDFKQTELQRLSEKNQKVVASKMEGF